jgi:rSAM/selenodomain-associated transferase 2
MSELFIIVPSYNEELTIEIFLLDLLSAIHSIKNVHLIVVDSGQDQTNDRAVQIAQTVNNMDVRVISSARGRALQMNLGASQVLNEVFSKDYFWFLHSDTQLPRDIHQWWRHVQTLEPEWGFFPVRLSGQFWWCRVIEWLINRRSAATSIGTGDQGLFVRADIWQSLGGFKEMPLMEDVELCKRLRRSSSPVISLSRLTTSSRRWEKRGVIRTIVLMWALRFGFFIGVRASFLARLYRF